MSEDERSKWDGTYAQGAEAGNTRIVGPPSAALAWAGCPATGADRALDLGCGLLRNARPLADLGWRVLGADVSRVGLARARPFPKGFQALHADLDHWTPPPRSFDLIIAIHYLNRPLLPVLAEALRPGGALLMEIRLDPDAGPDKPPRGFRLAPLEVARLLPQLVLTDLEENDERGLYRFVRVE